MAEQANWYVAHTYSGYENKVATDLMTMVENRHLQDLICDVKVPTETRIEEVFDKRGNKTGEKEVQSKLYPGYVFRQNGHERQHLVHRAQHARLHRLCRPGVQARAPDRGGSCQDGRRNHRLTLRSSTRSVIRSRSPPVRWKAPSAPSTRSTFLRARCA